MAEVVIAGAGFGGISAAVSLTRELGPGTVTLIDRRADFAMGLRKAWAVFGIEELAHGTRRLDELGGIEFVQGEITEVDPPARAVAVDGRRYSGDALIIALGAQHAMGALPGLAEHGINVWDRAEAERARAAFERLRGKGRGRLLIGVFGQPYPCPPAPYEFGLLARDHLPADVEVSVFTPAPMALSIAGPTESAKLEGLLAKRGVTLTRERKPSEVRDGEVLFADGPSEAFDVLFAVPPHRCPQLLVDAGLAAAGGWVKPDPRTMELADHPDVYAVGDCTAIPLTNGMALPKAGVFAHAQGETVAARIVARLRGETPTATFAGDGLCFLETGRGEAAKTHGSFLADPPQVQVSSPDAATMAEKRDFEHSRLVAWFGR